MSFSSLFSERYSVALEILRVRQISAQKLRLMGFFVCSALTLRV
jgi:hypothetical protein